MSTTIITKHNDTTGNAPITLAHGETAINIADQKMWVGDSSNSPILLVQTNPAFVVEPTSVSATAATGTVNYDVGTQSVVYYTSNASANWTLNLRWNSSTSLDSQLSTGENVTVAFMVTQGATAYYNNVLKIDGTTVTPVWQGGAAPTFGNASSIDVYTYCIVKTGSATFKVFASITQFK